MKRQLTILALATTMMAANAQTAPQLGKASIDEVIAAMTLEEKAQLIVGTYTFSIGSSSADIKAKLTAKVAASTVKVNDILKPQSPINTLKR